MSKRTIFAILFVIFGIIFIISQFLKKEETETPQSTPVSVVPPQPMDFNKEDKAAFNNGNIEVAFKKIANSSSEALYVKADSVSGTNLSQNTYSNLGKFIRLRGRIHKIEELPPSSGLIGTRAINFMCRNENAPTRMTTVSYLCTGDVSLLKVNQRIEAVGYFVGTTTGQNAFGGNVEIFVMVGKQIDLKEKL